MSEKEFSEWRGNVVLQIIIGAVVLYVLVKFIFLITSIGYKSNELRLCRELKSAKHINIYGSYKYLYI